MRGYRYFLLNTSIGGQFGAKMLETPLQCWLFVFEMERELASPIPCSTTPHDADIKTKTVAAKAYEPV